jgi:hypothetical protein
MPLLDDVIVREAGRFIYRTGPHGAPSNAGNPLEVNQQCLLSIRNRSGGTELDYVCVHTRERKRRSTPPSARWAGAVGRTNERNEPAPCTPEIVLQLVNNQRRRVFRGRNYEEPLCFVYKQVTWPERGLLMKIGPDFLEEIGLDGKAPPQIQQHTLGLRSGRKLGPYCAQGATVCSE